MTSRKHSTKRFISSPTRSFLDVLNEIVKHLVDGKIWL